MGQLAGHGSHAIGQHHPERAVVDRHHLTDPQPLAGKRDALPLPGQPDIKGQLELSYGLRFEPSDTTLRLTQARVERLDVDGLNAAQAAQVKKVGGLLAEDLLNEAVVHRFKKEDLESLAGRGYRPGALRVVPGGLQLTLEPLPR